MIPAVTRATISIRLAPGQDPEAMGAELVRLLRAGLPEGAELEVVSSHSAQPALFAVDTPAIVLAAAALERACGVAPAFVRTGGSIPIVADFGAKGIPTIVTGFVLPDDPFHAPDESFSLRGLELGYKSARELLIGLADLEAAVASRAADAAALRLHPDCRLGRPRGARRAGRGAGAVPQLRHRLHAAVGPRPRRRPDAGLLGGLRADAASAGDAGGRVRVAASAAGFGEALFEVLAFLALGILGWLVYALGRAWFNGATGVVAALIVLTREPVFSYGVRAYVDIPYICLLLGALLVETRRPRAGTPVLVLVALAGLLRPEAWLFAFAYVIWLWRGGALDPDPHRAASSARRCCGP